MFWHIVKYIQLKTVNGHTFSDIKVIKQEVLKEETQISEPLPYPIIKKCSKEVKWSICN